MIPAQLTVSCATEVEASEIVDEVMHRRLAASAQVWSIDSCYRWKGQVVRAPEYLLLLKTVEAHFDAICDIIRSIHSYDVPSTMIVPIINCEPQYLEWIIESVTEELNELN